MSLAATQTGTTPRWERRAWALAWFTVLWNLLEGGVSIAFGVADDSVALWGFGADSLIEVASAIVVMARLAGASRLPPQRPSGWPPWPSAGSSWPWPWWWLGKPIRQLAAGKHPPTTVRGWSSPALSLAFMGFLWQAKLRAAAALDNAALKSDAACSRACIQLSLVLLGGSLLFLLSPRLWWVDGAAAILLALLIGREGLGMIRAARDPHFTGGCGCGQD